MIRPDFSNQPYVAEVLRSPAGDAVVRGIERLIVGKWERETAGDVAVHHGLTASTVPYHRVTRNIKSEGVDVSLPRTKSVRNRVQYLYDLLLVRRDRHIVVAVPFHGLATDVFVRIDRELAGTRTLYETLDITKLVIRLGSQGHARLPESELVVTRCHLAFEDSAERRRDIDQVRLSGANLGASPIYTELIRPVLEPSAAQRVTPILLGCALYSGGVRRSGATTDRHGNFKVTVGPGLRQLTRLFQLIDVIEGMSNDVASTTSNIPILQSQSIAGAD
jgi:hypothetical protein